MHIPTCALFFFAFILAVLGSPDAKYCPVGKGPDTVKGATHTTVMRLIKDAQNECKREGKCPRRLAPEANKKCVKGKSAAEGYECSDVDLAAFVPLADLGCGANNAAEGNDIWGWTDTSTSKRYVAAGCTDGTSFVDVTDSEKPAVLGFLPSHNGISSIWRDIKIYKGYAYIVADDQPHGLQIFDMKTLQHPDIIRNAHYPNATVYDGIDKDDKDAMNKVAQKISKSITQLTAVHKQFWTWCHNFVINPQTGYGYAVGANKCDGGPIVLKLEGPDTHCVGCFAADGYTHDAQVVTYHGPDRRFAGREILFAFNEDTLAIVDVTDKNNMKLISQVEYYYYAYTHQGWLTTDHKWVITDDELDEYYAEKDVYQYTRTIVINIEKLDAPEVVDYHHANKKAIDHNLYVDNANFVYQTNYIDGLRILYFNETNASLDPVAFYDMSQLYDDQLQYGWYGAWSSYPFSMKPKSKSKTIAVQCIENGLYLLEMTGEAAELHEKMAEENKEHRIMEHLRHGRHH